MPVFSDCQFIESLKELDNPVLDEYELFVELSGIKVYRKFIEESSLYEYKVTGELVSNANLFVKVYMDLEYRKKWDSYVKELYETEDEKDGEYIYWNVNFPFPMSKRDYTYIRKYRCVTEQTPNKIATWVILSQSKTIASCPEKSGVIRVNEYQQNLVLQYVDEEHTKIFMHYKDNPGGSIPTWLINWAAKKGVPNFLEEMKKAGVGYAKYLEKK